MQKRRQLLFSLGCGVVCAVCVLLFMASVQGEVSRVRSESLERYGGDQLEVCVARRDIAPGETISSSDIEMKLWVAALLPRGAATNSAEIVGSTVSSMILSGEAITEKRLGNESSLLEVPDGMVAVSVPAKSVQAVGGAVSPGLRVDVYATGNTSTSRIGESLLVLATSASTDDRSSAEVQWITLAVSPSQTQQMVAAAQSTGLYFTLPSTTEVASVNNEQASEQGVQPARS